MVDSIGYVKIDTPHLSLDEIKIGDWIICWNHSYRLIYSVGLVQDIDKSGPAGAILTITEFSPMDRASSRMPCYRSAVTMGLEPRPGGAAALLDPSCRTYRLPAEANPYVWNRIVVTAPGPAPATNFDAPHPTAVRKSRGVLIASSV